MEVTDRMQATMLWCATCRGFTDGTDYCGSCGVGRCMEGEKKMTTEHHPNPYNWHVVDANGCVVKQRDKHINACFRRYLDARTCARALRRSGDAVAVVPINIEGMDAVKWANRNDKAFD